MSGADDMRYPPVSRELQGSGGLTIGTRLASNVI